MLRAGTFYRTSVSGAYLLCVGRLRQTPQHMLVMLAQRRREYNCGVLDQATQRLTFSKGGDRFQLRSHDSSWR